jgi:hypothetical protein
MERGLAYKAKTGAVRSRLLAKKDKSRGRDVFE